MRASLRAAAVGGGVALLSLPLIVAGALLPPTSSPLTDATARGNLIGPLDPWQAAGIWPSGDFRLAPEHELVAYGLIAAACAAAAAGLAWSIGRRAPGPALYVLGALVACAALVLVGSPWVGGKALATASPAIPFAAMLGVGWLAGSGRGVAAGALALVIVGGVVWSNALGYGGVSLAPRSQLAELERIGELVAGEGPTLMTEYEPYGVRHFLRDSDPEGISELRRRTIPLRDSTHGREGRLRRHRRGRSARPGLLPDPRPATLAGAEPPALPLSPGLAGGGLRGLAAPGERLAAARAPAARRSLRPVRDAGLRQGPRARRAR